MSFMCRTMADELTCINRVNDRSGIHYIIEGPSLEECWKNVKRLGLVALSLRGHEETLFKTHLSFKGAQERFQAPVMSVSKPLKNVIGLDLDNLQKRLSNQLSAVLETIFHLNFSDDDVSNERKVDKPYLQGVLTTFIKFPTLSYNEVQLEYHSKKKLVGGSIDVVVGSESNGNKPYIYVHPKNVSIYLGSLLDAKSSSKCLAASNSASFDQSSEEIKALIQPMLELMAISEVAEFPKADVPLLNIFGNKVCTVPCCTSRSMTCF